MSFVNPLGFLGLIAVPVLILIYILKRKYTEQVISSTYLWTLSERFLRRKNPISRITGIISLILQIFIVIFISLAIANPVFVLKGMANDYCFVLDASGSMNMTLDGSTRFERARDVIEQRIRDSAEGSYYTLVVVGDVTSVEYRDMEDKATAIQRLGEVQPSQSDADTGAANLRANEYFTANPSVNVVFVTDKNYSQHENVEVINVTAAESNYAVTDAEYSVARTGVTVTGTLYSYAADAQLNVDVFADGAESAAASAQCEVKQGVGTSFTVNLSQDYVGFSSIRVQIRETDSLPDDNAVILYQRESAATYSTLIVSDAPFFLEATFATFGNMQRKVIATEDYDPAVYSGYGLYVFDSFSPAEMPSDGAVWFVNPTSNVKGSGFTNGSAIVSEEAIKMQLNSSTSTKVQTLLKDTIASEELLASMTQYVKCRLNGTFITLASCNGDPVIFAGSNNYDNREVVFAFNLRETTDFVLSYNYLILMRNLIDYTFPALVDDGTFYCGDALTVNVLTGCTAIRVDSPSGKIEYLDTDEAFTEYVMKEVGEYTVTATINGTQQSVNVFCSLPEEERRVTAEGTSFSVDGEASTVRRDGRYDDLLYIFIILAVLVIADWMVYCYEQYQLR